MIRDLAPAPRPRAPRTGARGGRAAGGGGARRGAAAPRGRRSRPRWKLPPAGRALKSALERRAVRIERGEREPSSPTLADTEHPQGVVAVVEPRRWTTGRISRSAPGRPVLVLDAVQDPGNVGTILRTALGLGAAGVVALKGTAELTSPKVVRGSMGALFRLPAVAADAVDELLAWAGERRVELWVAEADGEPLEPGAARGHAAPVATGRGKRGRGCRFVTPGRRDGAGWRSPRAGSGVAQRGGRRRHPASTRSRVWSDAELPPWAFVAWFALLGAALGSFLNVCILRWGAEPKQSVMHPPSRCPRCGHEIRWYENIPIFSWLFLRGRCSGCGLPISPMYPAIEARHGAHLGWGGWRCWARRSWPCSSRWRPPSCSESP